MPSSIGPYRLAARLGKGGMGEVWQAIHTPTERAVAVKVLSENEPSFADAVRLEAEAVAALDHPHIVALLDVGTIPQDSADWIGGSPYLVMELLDGGTLRQRAPGMDWAETRRMLDALLDGLGHAHARELIHRDLKPANVMRAGPTDPRPGWRISDFGLAHAHGDASATVREGARGSPRYMAPEQFSGYRRDFGPWTDLYGLGCLAWAVVTGRPVFQARDLPGLQRAHLQQTPPALHPRFPTPEGLEDWLRRLLAKRAGDRFPTAADAQVALARIDRGEPLAPARAAQSGRLPASGTFYVTMTSDGFRTPELEPAFDTDGGIREVGLPPKPPAPPHPPSWRHRAEVAPRAHLGTASLALVDLRAPPFVGRDAERDELWSLLGEVHHTNEPRLVLLTGAPGQGESALAEWLVHRARETGSAHALRAHHSLVGGGGAAELVTDALHLHGLDASDTRARLAYLAGQGEIPSDLELDSLVRTTHADPSPPTLDEERATLLSILRRLVRDRPVVLFLDDLHRSAESRELVRFLMAQPLPLFIVATGQPTGEADDAVGAADLVGLAAEFSAAHLELGPLDAFAVRALIRRMVDLDDTLAQRLEIASQGHPLFILETLEGWVRDGVLTAGHRGWQLAKGAEITLPGSLHQAVTEHLERALGDRADDERRAVEVAAILGDPIDIRRWVRVCLLAGARPGPDLVAHLLASGVWRRESVPDSPIRFASSPVRSALTQQAAKAGRATAYHRGAARMIQEEGGSIARLGLHQLRAGAPDLAIANLLGAAEEVINHGDLGETARALAWLDEALQAADPDRHGEARARAHVIHATLHILRGAGPDADEDLDAAEALTQQGRWPAVRAQIAVLRGRRATRERRYDQALAHLKRATKWADQAKDRRLQGRALYQRGNLLLYLGRIDEAERNLLAARPLSRAHPADLGKVLVALAKVHKQRGAHAEARRSVQEAAPWFVAANSAWGRIVVRGFVADLDRAEGALDDAAAGYLDTYHGYLRLGLRQADVALLNLGMVELARAHIDGARAIFTHCLAAFKTQRAPMFIAVAWAGRLATDAAQGDGAAFDDALTQVRSALDRTGFVHIELAETLETAERYAREHLTDRRADAAGDLARAQRRSLGLP